MAVQEYLPGSPTKRLVKLVRMILRKYGISSSGFWCNLIVDDRQQKWLERNKSVD